MKTKQRGWAICLSVIATTSMLFSNIAPVFAQLGDVVPPPAPPPVVPPVVPPPEPIVIPPPEPVVVSPPSPTIQQVITPLADTTAPVVSGVVSLSLATHEATLVWTTDELTVSTFQYGTTQNYGSSATISASAALGGTAVLTGLTPGTIYYYCIHAIDLAGNTTNSCDHTFTTATQTVLLDTTPPDITLITIAPITTTQVTVSFTTSEVGNARVEYGTSTAYGETTALDTNLALTHSVTLSSLTPNTLYHYRVITSDELGNETVTSDETFTTEALGAGGTVNTLDTTPPTISGIGTIALGLTDATLAWSTNELATSTLEYGVTQNYGSHATLSLSALLTHTATLTGLSAHTTYYYCIRATDLHGNMASSCPHSFTTGGQAQMEVPVSGVNIAAIDTASIATSTVTITWETDLPADSQVEYGVSEDFGSASTLSPTLTTSHSVTLTGLSPNTNYIFRVKSKPAGAALAAVSSNDEFSTLTHSTPVVPPANIISVSSGSVTSTAATITWTTDKGATSQVEYGIRTGYGIATVENATLTTSHSVSLANLEPNTTYHFRVKSTDEVSNETFSEDYTFTTPSVASTSGTNGTTGGTSVPAAITTLAIGGYDNTSGELVWHVGTTTSDLTAEYDIRYSTSPITALNFASAAAAQSTPVYYGDLSPNGTERVYIVAGLTPNTTYYFALKLKHQNSTYSDISNVVSLTTTSGVSITTQNISTNTGSSSGASSANSLAGQAQHQLSPESGAGQAGQVSGGQGSVRVQYGGGSGGTGIGSFEPTMVKAEPADGQIIFEWKNPGEANFVRTVIVRKEGGYPTSPTDGKTIYEGRGDTYTETLLQNGKTYYYAVYSYNHAKTYSKGVNVSLAPNAGNKQIKFNESGTLASSTPLFHFVRKWQKGDKDIEIEHLQELLVTDQDSYPEKYVTGYFGALTEAALRRFQKKHGLLETGVVDPQTQKELNILSQSETRLDIPTDLVVFETNLKRGDQSEAVKDLQQYLIYEGSYVEAIVSGYFGSYTFTAVKKFQAKYGIQPVSGYVAYKTRHKMRELVGL